jgi:two-component system, OmpR family, response regulator
MSVSMKILIVEDEADAADSLAVLLRVSGHDVHVTFDGPSALSAAESRPPDVVLLDLGLPGMDGWEVVRRLRQMRFSRRPQVIAVTGYDGAEHRKRSYQMGVDFHLAKPADPEMISAVLERLELLSSK